MTSSRTLLGTIDFNEAKRIRSVLEDRGVKVEIVNNPDTCSTGGCKPTVEVYIQESDRVAVQAFIEEEKAREMAGLEFDAALLGEVFDPEKESARCPACGTSFSTSLKECPDCGLVFG